MTFDDGTESISNLPRLLLRLLGRVFYAGHMAMLADPVLPSNLWLLFSFIYITAVFSRGLVAIVMHSRRHQQLEIDHTHLPPDWDKGESRA
jgi:hypothetical protein